MKRKTPLNVVLGAIECQIHRKELNDISASQTTNGVYSDSMRHASWIQRQIRRAQCPLVMRKVNEDIKMITHQDLRL